MIRPEIYINPDSIKMRDIVRVVLNKNIELDDSIEVYDDSTVYPVDLSSVEQSRSQSTDPDELDNVEPTPTNPANENLDNIVTIGRVTLSAFLPSWVGGNWR